MKPYVRMICSFIAISILAITTSCSSRPYDPLAVGWKFACAITDDPDDMAKCQEKVAAAYVARGDAAMALRLGEQIKDWNKGVILAKAAVRLVECGQTNEALKRAEQAQAIAGTIQDWERDRILAGVVKVKALLGKEEEVSTWSGLYSGNRDYRGEIAAYHALALARDGRATNALAVLDGLADTTFLDVSSWRASGYMLLAKAGKLDMAQASNALAQAWAASSRIPGNKRYEIQFELVDAAASAGAGEQAREWIAQVATNLATSREPAHIKAPLMGLLAVRRGLLRQAEELADCTKLSEPLIGQLQNIEQPGLVALLGEAWVRLGDVSKGLTYYEQAMEQAGQLTNLRPRAIACVDICLSLERCGLSDKRISDGLLRLLAGFGAAHG